MPTAGIFFGQMKKRILRFIRLKKIPGESPGTGGGGKALSPFDSCTFSCGREVITPDYDLCGIAPGANVKIGPERPFIASAANERLTALLVVLIFPENPISPLDLLKDQFRHNDFSIGTFHQVMKTLSGIFLAPVYDGRDLAGDKIRAYRGRECLCHPPEGPPLKILDLPAISDTGEPDWRADLRFRDRLVNNVPITLAACKRQVDHPHFGRLKEPAWARDCRQVGHHVPHDDGWRLAGKVFVLSLLMTIKLRRARVMAT